jgi:SAM-dependent methyltransferase
MTPKQLRNAREYWNRKQAEKRAREYWNRKQAEKRARTVHLRSALEWNTWATRHPTVTSLDELDEIYLPLINDNGWLYGYWVCDLSSPDFMNRVINLFGGPEGWQETGWLHVSGEPPLPFEAETLDVIFVAPPIDEDHGTGQRKGKLPPYPLKKLVAEAYRTLKPGGYFAMLHVYTGPPRFNKKWKSRTTIGVAPALQCKWTRTLSVIQKMK